MNHRLLKAGAYKLPPEPPGTREKLLEPRQVTNRDATGDSVDRGISIQVEDRGCRRQTGAARLEDPSHFPDAGRRIWKIAQDLDTEHEIKACIRERYTFNIR